MGIEPNTSRETSLIGRPHTRQQSGEIEAERTIHVDRARRFLIVRHPPDPTITALLRRVEGRRYHRGHEGRDPHWTIPIQSAYALQPLIEQFGFSAEGKVRRYIERQSRLRRANLENSAATDSDIDLGAVGERLYPFQRAGVEYALRNRRTFIADSMGLGKTVEALITLEAADAYPALIITPASVKLNWGREAARWLPGREAVVWEGDFRRTPPRHEIVIVNYDLLGKFKGSFAQVEWKAVVLDESHYAKNPDSQRSQHCRDLAQHAEYRLLLTGTPLLNRPIELVSQLDIMGRLDDFGGYLKFVRRYCGADALAGWEPNGATHLHELNHKLRSLCYLRREKADVLSELPPKQRHVVALPLSNRAEYEAAQRDLAAWYASHHHENGGSARRAEALAGIERLRQLCAWGKLEAVIEWAENLIDTGEKLVLFAHHLAIVNALGDHFNAPRISGDTPLDERQAAVDRFQTDPDCRVIVGNLQAMGHGLTLTAATNVAFAELGWTPALHAQGEDRIHRIGQDEQVTAWYLVAPGTLDEDMLRLLDRKRRVVSRATGGNGAGS